MSKVKVKVTKNMKCTDGAVTFESDCILVGCILFLIESRPISTKCKKVV